jgi:ribokinase
MLAPKLCVVGSSNLDLNSYVERFPAPGETLMGRRFTTVYGGKGANQAVQAARLGAAVSFVGKVGNDLFGQDMLANLRQEGMDATYVSTTDQAASGVALIVIEASGMNSIIVISGANSLLSEQDVEAARPVISSAQVLVCQMEVPMAANLAAMRIAHAAGVPILFNPAPISGPVPTEVYQLADIFCPNESEAQLLTGQPVDSMEQAQAAGRILLGRGARQVILTLGARGSLLVTPQQVLQVPAPQVKAVDTTGAGDSFVGSLAFFLGHGLDLPTAMHRASQIAAQSVQKAGAQTSFPHAHELPSDWLATSPG